MTNIQFISYHKPPLEDGKYTVTATQTIQTTSNKIANTSFASTPITLLVEGERYTLNPTEVKSVFPPNGNLGDTETVLPHILLNRTTLPWERLAQANDTSNAPWLALIVFNQSETPTPKIRTLEELTDPSKEKEAYPNDLIGSSVGITMPPHADGQEKITVIDVPKNIIEPLLPDFDSLYLGAHVRSTTPKNKTSHSNNFSVVVAHRLPAPGQQSTVHLISLENRYTNNSFDFQTATNTDLIRFVSLYSWSFTSLDPKQNFKALLTNLDKNVMRYPTNSNTTVETYLSQGRIPLNEQFRNGSISTSWYHGPCVPTLIQNTLSLPAKGADQLLRFDTTTGMFDVTYAAAWELGRLSCLANQRIATAFYQWKCNHVTSIKQSEQSELTKHLAINTTPTTTTLPQVIEDWINEYRILKGLPFHYLIPDDTILPSESIRFFYLDPLWIDAFIDGAFAIGRVATTDIETAGTLQEQVKKFSTITGFIIRSEVISGWPTLEIQAKNADGVELNCLRNDLLSKQVRICLFDGEIDEIIIHEKPEVLHFGVSINTTTKAYYKQIRNSSGGTTTQEVDIPYSSESLRIINTSTLAASIQTALTKKTTPLSSANFALEMIVGVDSVTFTRGGAS